MGDAAWIAVSDNLAWSVAVIAVAVVLLALLRMAREADE